jgi:hypothetical protein
VCVRALFESERRRERGRDREREEKESVVGIGKRAYALIFAVIVMPSFMSPYILLFPSSFFSPSLILSLSPSLL